MTTTQQSLVRHPNLNRERLRMERNMISSDEIAAKMTNPNYWWLIDPACAPLTDEQWRQVGIYNGVVIR